MSIPSPAEVRCLLASADESYAALVAVCAFAGLRLGEAAALRVSDFDFLRREIHVHRQVQLMNGGGVEFRAPKYGSERTAFAPDQLLEVLSEHIRVHRPGDDADQWMFPGRNCDPVHQNSVGYLWRKTTGKAKVTCKLHDMRHFYASGLIDGGCDVVKVQRAMGHSAASITLDTCSHLWENAEDRTRNAASAMFDQVMTEESAYPVRTEEREGAFDLQFHEFTKNA